VKILLILLLCLTAAAGPQLYHIEKIFVLAVLAASSECEIFLQAAQQINNYELNIDFVFFGSPLLGNQY
jgi:hypothetical protein